MASLPEDKEITYQSPTKKNLEKTFGASPMKSPRSNLGSARSVNSYSNRLKSSPRSESGYSVNSNISVAESVISRAMSRKGKI